MHNNDNPDCPLNDAETFANPATAGMACTCEVWIEKVWGRTRCVYESDVFSGHELEVKQCGYCSVHYHANRANRFIVNQGVIAVVTFHAWKIKRTILTVGKTFDVPSLVPHQFQVIQSGRIREEYWSDCGGDVDKHDIVRLTQGGIVDDLEELKELAASTIRTFA